MKWTLPLFRKVWSEVSKAKDWSEVSKAKDAHLYFKEVKPKEPLPKDRIAIEITIPNAEALKRVINIFYNAGYLKHREDVIICA